MTLPKILSNITKAILGNYLSWTISSIWHKKSGKTLILNFHRVSNSRGSLWTPCPIDTFNLFLKESQKFFEIVSFQDIGEKRKKAALILSFDDGYLDFYENVAPILDSESLKCNQNIIPHCVVTGRPPINVLIQDFAGLAPESLLATIEWGIKFENSRNPRAELLQFSQSIKSEGIAKQAEAMDLIFPQIQSYPEFMCAKMMTLSQIQSLPKHFSIGNHSFRHVNANAMTLDEFKMDLRSSQEWFEKNGFTDKTIYAFPNGAYSTDHVVYLIEEGYQHILLVSNSSSENFSKVRKRVNATPQNIQEARFDSLRPLIRVL